MAFPRPSALLLNGNDLCGVSGPPFFLTGALIVLGGAIAVLARDADAAAVDACIRKADGQQTQIDCLYGLIEARMRAAGITDAMLLFQRVYDMSEVFAKSGCHTHAHRVGDMAYYQFYVPTRDLDSLELEGETGACGYGFYHGFMEHLVQEHPDPTFVTETCERLDARVRAALGDIRPICYHGSGHGFMLRHVEDLPIEAWGDIARFVEEPLKRCGELVRASPREREECEEGGLQRVSRVDGDEAVRIRVRLPVRLYEMVASVDAALRPMVFSVGVAGMVQPLAGTDEYRTLIDECLLLEDAYRQLCLVNVPHGLFEQGQPGEEYRKPLLVCADPRLAAKGVEDDCYGFVALKLPRFYDAQRRAEICTGVPEAYRGHCAG